MVLGIGNEEPERRETDENGIVTYIYKLDWNTLPFHNGEHELELKVTFTLDIGEPETIELKQNVDILNLVVSASPEYLLYDPDVASPNMTINYDLRDAVTDNETVVTVNIFTSDQTLVKSETVTVTAPGSHSYVWDGKDSEGNLMEKGIYIYRISASQPSQGDYDCEKSDWGIASTGLEIIDAQDNQVQVRIGYHLVIEYGCDAVTGKLAKVEVFDPHLNMSGPESVANPPVNQNNVFPDLFIPIEEGGAYTFLVSAVDNHPAHDRKHYDRPNGVRPLLQNNQQKTFKPYVVLIDPGHGGTFPLPDGYNYGTLGCYYNLAPSPALKGKNRYPWDEKDFALELARRLKYSLIAKEAALLREGKRIHIAHSRTADVAIANSDRVKWANRQKKKFDEMKIPYQMVFVSLHANGLRDSWKSDNPIFWRKTVDIPLADAVLAKLLETPKPYSWIYYKPTRLYRWEVLSANMPSILIEACTLTCPEEEDWVKWDSSDVNLKKLADKIRDGILNFF